ncbi:MAG TPA: alternative ribosome rescue aminoacyl-tRNA hydrolase ArfB [Acidimicrobiales bacterium]|nr:alternative ribosome rescue aminoacyl-tRNA hydrolase ArfB [Acidimicrobiales bacterium]
MTSDEGVLRVTRTCTVPLHELSWRFTPSGGPGGQHANRSNTRVELTFDVAASSAFGPVQRERAVAALGGPVVRVVVDDERSQLRNREIALERLRSRLASALAVPKDRRPTKPSRAAAQRRLDDKRRRSEVKRMRRRPDD